ncbi:uncharacterized protein BJX67DRAFT_312600 [Aspergillus lucknowensis]|uniref:Ubiquitin-related domain-containing protein n=1 Tax=Aspergillus lucknowensis TaxID=176173 RepID=A0ABR4LA84_9EURO
MASEDHAQSDGPGPAATSTDNSTPTAPNSSQPVSSSTFEASDSAVNSSSLTTAPQDITATGSNTSTANGDQNPITTPQQQSTIEDLTTTVSPETEEQKIATTASELSSGAAANEPEASGPTLTIVLLLITGTRHPFKIDGNYLRKRGISVDNDDPFAMSVYTLKELIWRAWQDDWEPRPLSPSSIRLISFGKLLDDKSPLSDSKFSRDAPNVVHMTVKPQEIVDEEDAKGTKGQYSRDREASERSPRCRCVIQ